MPNPVQWVWVHCMHGMHLFFGQAAAVVVLLLNDCSGFIDVHLLAYVGGIYAYPTRLKIFHPFRTARQIQDDIYIASR